MSEIEFGKAVVGKTEVTQWLVVENGIAHFEVRFPNGWRPTGDTLARAMQRAEWADDWEKLKWVRGYEIRLSADMFNSANDDCVGFAQEMASVRGWICYRDGETVPYRFKTGKRPRRDKAGVVDDMGMSPRSDALYLHADEVSDRIHELLGIQADIVNNYVNARLLNPNYAREWLPNYIKALIDITPRG